MGHFQSSKRWPSRATASCDAFVTFNNSGSASPEQAAGGVDGGLQGDEGVLPVAVPGGVDVEWNRYRFALDAPAQLREGERFTVSAQVQANVSTSATLYLMIDGRLANSLDVTIDPGSSDVDERVQEVARLTDDPAATFAEVVDPCFRRHASGADAVVREQRLVTYERAELSEQG